MNQTDCDRIKDYCAKATAGPWAYENCGEKCNDWIVGVAFHKDDTEAARPINGLVPQDDYNESTGQFIETVIRKCILGGDLMTGSDAHFIAHARTDLPAAIAEIERLRRLCGEAEHIISVRYGGVLDQYAHQHDDWEKDIIKQLQSSKPL